MAARIRSPTRSGSFRPRSKRRARDTVGVDLRSLYAKVAASLPESLKFPDTVRFGLTLAAQDGAGNADTVIVDRSTEGVALTVMVVQGRTVMLPDGGVIADAVVDTARQRLYLSNHTFNKVEVLDLAAYAFDPIRAGSGDSSSTRPTRSSRTRVVRTSRSFLDARPGNTCNGASSRPTRCSTRFHTGSTTRAVG